MRKNGGAQPAAHQCAAPGSRSGPGEHGHRVGFGALHAHELTADGRAARRLPFTTQSCAGRFCAVRLTMPHTAESRDSRYLRAACPARKLAITHRGPHPAAAPSPPLRAAPTGISASCPRTCLPFCQLPRFPRTHKAGRSAYAASPGSFHYPAARRPAQDMWQAQKWPPPRSRIAGRSWEQMSLA